MADKKVIFVAFAIEDVRQRDFLKGHSLNPKCPYEFVDYSVKEAYSSEWKEKVRTRIRRSDGVMVLVSKNSSSSSGQKWEIACAKDEKSRFMPFGFTRTTGRRFQASRQRCGHGMALPSSSTDCRAWHVARLLSGSMTMADRRTIFVAASQMLTRWPR